MPVSSKWSLSLRFPHPNPVYAPSLPHMRYMPRPSHSSRFYRRTILGEEYRSLSPSLCSFFLFPVKVSPLAVPNLNQIFLIITSTYGCPHTGDQSGAIRQLTSVDQFSSFSSPCSCTIKGYLDSSLKITTIRY